jgi:putative ABC transport system substrate-binding protein
VPSASFAQQSKVWRIGFLSAGSASGYVSEVEALRAGLRDLGYFEQQNIAIEFGWAEGKYDRLSELAAELVGRKVDVIVTQGTPATSSAKLATKTVPIVMANAGDAIVTGLVSNLARPGGNITGSTVFNPELGAKRLELLKEAFPRTRHIAVLLNPDNSVSGPILKAMQITAKSLKFELHHFEVRGLSEIETAFGAMSKLGVSAVTIQSDAIFTANARVIADFSSKRRMLSAGPSEFAEAGGLIGYGTTRVERFRRVAYFVDKIIRGTKPADIPVEQPTKFELVLNLKTAKAMGIKFPQSFLVRADRVIE